MGRAMNDDEAPEQSYEDKQREIDEQAKRDKGDGKGVKGCLEGIVWLASPVVLYFGLVWLVGLWPNPAVAWYFYFFGGLLSVVMMFFISIMGETMIEDMVKFVIIALAALGISQFLEAPGQAVVVGMAAGAGLPLLYRIWPGVG